MTEPDVSDGGNGPESLLVEADFGPDGAAGLDVPDLVPARMVNEFAYCRRLFFLEWVGRRFRVNRDTVDGRYQHRRVDQPGGAAPLPNDAILLVTAQRVVGRAVGFLVGRRRDVEPVEDVAVRPAHQHALG